MTAVAKPRRSGIRAAERSIRGTMVAHSGARQTTVGAPAGAAPARALAPAPASASVTSPSRVAIPSRQADVVEPEPETKLRARSEPRVPARQPPAPRIQGRAPSRPEPPPVVRPVQRSRRIETFDEPVAPAPSKMSELRSTIARLQQRLDVLEPHAARFDDMQARHEIVVELLEEALDLLGRPDGVNTRRRITAKLQEACKVLG